VETITIKLDENMLGNIDKSLKKHNFSTRTEFIRDALREKLEGLSREELIEAALSIKMKRRKDAIGDWDKVKEVAFENLAKERGWKLK
jgi:metal-responsive CopG/Arc/MetJ family transcriptional regulator